MLKEFLSHTHTQAVIDKDFKEWHLGIPYYGFWAILIDAPVPLKLVSKAQSHLQSFFLPNYNRQAHITLNASGLIAEAHFSQAKLAQQILALSALNLSPFSISIGHINSFSTAAYLNITDNQNTLLRINQTLENVACDSKPDVYKPHITLGLYREKFESKIIAKEILKYPRFEPLHFKINEIQFCRYKTSAIQGPIEVIKRIHLEQVGKCS